MDPIACSPPKFSLRRSPVDWNWTSLAEGRFSTTPIDMSSVSAMTKTRDLCRYCCERRKAEGIVDRRIRPLRSNVCVEVGRFDVPVDVEETPSWTLDAKEPSKSSDNTSSPARCSRYHSRSIWSGKMRGRASSSRPMARMSSVHVCMPTSEWSFGSRDDSSNSCCRTMVESAAARCQLPRSSSPWSCSGPQPAYPTKSQKSSLDAMPCWTMVLASSKDVL
mmetsp:Transcript_26259/g.76563  ORF Transcript_26259/g.76563 Transcript_26259/m.76563 type:complete len:220 (-) Transcript_26259:673-1332(-)